MSFENLSRRGAALAFSLILAAAPSGVFAAPQDYRFELAGTPQPADGGKSVVPVRLVRVTGGKPVTDAVVFEAKADMGPASMAAMTAPVRALPPQNGVYRFEVEPGMAGPWALNLAAKVHSEADTVRGSVIAELVKQRGTRAVRGDRERPSHGFDHADLGRLSGVSRVGKGMAAAGSGPCDGGATLVGHAPSNRTGERK